MEVHDGESWPSLLIATQKVRYESKSTRCYEKLLPPRRAAYTESNMTPTYFLIMLPKTVEALAPLVWEQCQHGTLDHIFTATADFT